MLIPHQIAARRDIPAEKNNSHLKNINCGGNPAVIPYYPPCFSHLGGMVYIIKNHNRLIAGDPGHQVEIIKSWGFPVITVYKDQARSDSRCPDLRKEIFETTG